MLFCVWLLAVGLMWENGQGHLRDVVDDLASC